MPDSDQKPSKNRTTYGKYLGSSAPDLGDIYNNARQCPSHSNAIRITVLTNT